MELKEGMYVKTNEGLIHQILDTEIQIKFRFDTGSDIPFYENGEYKNQILKASYNIIDLIEVGDYVNGYKVLRIEKDYLYNYREEINILIVQNDEVYEVAKKIYSDGIKSIVTKEQFSQMEYRLGD